MSTAVPSRASERERTAARPMDFTDIPRVLAIEREAYRFPWSGGVFKDCLRVGYSCWVLERGRELCGYGIMSVAARESHILNLCISLRRHRRGHGERLLRHLCAVAQAEGAERTLLEVRPSNDVAIRLYERHGFCQIAIRRGYYPSGGGREDAYVYALELADAHWLMRG